MDRIEFGELRFGETSRKNLMDCMDRNWSSGGPKVKEFEKKWGKLFGYKYNRAVSSGTDAVLNLVSTAYEYGAKRGDEIIVPALSFIASTNAVLMAGFTPVFVDVDLDTMNMDPSKIQAAITDKTVAILAVHTMGKMCEMDDICNIGQRHGLLIFEDACEAHGAKYTHYHPGGKTHGAAFSFYTAHLICAGEGGMVSTNIKKVANCVESTRTHGRKPGDLYFDHERVGYNSKMNDLEASLALEGIEDFWDTFHERKEILYKLMNATVQYSGKAWFSEENFYREVVCPHGFSVVLKDHAPIGRLTDTLDKYDIHWKRNFGCIPTQHRAYQWMDHKLGTFPNAEYIGDYGIHVGVHRYLSEKDTDRMVKAFQEYFEE
jgi:dTDP-4-amino-4,6-dideoxygalactose transaminase